MKRGNQMIKKINVTVFSMFVLMSLGFSSVWAQQYTDESGIPFMESISFKMTVEEYDAFRAEHPTDESGSLSVESSPIISSMTAEEYNAFWSEQTIDETEPQAMIISIPVFLIAGN